MLRAAGFGSNAKILELFDNDIYIRNTIERDNTETQEEALVEIYKRLRPGEPPTPESALSLFETLFYEPKRYDLAAVGRYKVNKKLCLGERILGQRLAQDVVDRRSGEVVVKAGIKVTRDILEQLNSADISHVYITGVDGSK